ncbi:MAG: hypothetical protein P9L99_17145 [Candidatus Lernaella stagnicola]|nr:hypothetical protein [Candidatus Lernaella stagnicola]
MRFLTGIAVFLLIVVALPAAAGEPISLSEKAAEAAMDFTYRPERNTTFTVAEDATTVYRSVQQLFSEFDYVPTARIVSRGDMIGPLISLVPFYQNKLKEVIMVRLKPLDEGTQVTIRGVFVVPGNNYILDRSEHKPTRNVRQFERFYDAKRELINAGDKTAMQDVLDWAQENLDGKRDLQATMDILGLVEDCTRPRSKCGKRGRRLIHELRAALRQQETLAAAIGKQQAQIDVAVANRDWLAAHLATDQLLHILHTGGVADDDPRMTAVQKTLAQHQRRLRSVKGSLVAFDPKIAPADGHDVAVGFTVLNAGSRPIASFKVKVDSTDAAGRASPGRIGRSYAYNIELDPPLAPNEYIDAAVVLRFEETSEVAAARVRFVSRIYGKKLN